MSPSACPASHHRRGRRWYAGRRGRHRQPDHALDNAPPLQGMTIAHPDYRFLSSLTTSPPRAPRHRNCNVKLDDLDGDRPDLDCELQQARGIPRNLRLDETVVLPSQTDLN